MPSPPNEESSEVIQSLGRFAQSGSNRSPTPSAIQQQNHRTMAAFAAARADSLQRRPRAASTRLVVVVRLSMGQGGEFDALFVASFPARHLSFRHQPHKRHPRFASSRSSVTMKCSWPWTSTRRQATRFGPTSPSSGKGRRGGQRRQLCRPVPRQL